jgi:hypothetical protein
MAGEMRRIHVVKTTSKRITNDDLTICRFKALHFRYQIQLGELPQAAGWLILPAEQG